MVTILCPLGALGHDHGAVPILTHMDTGMAYFCNQYWSLLISGVLSGITFHSSGENLINVTNFKV